jgi:hypothetical protein
MQNIFFVVLIGFLVSIIIASNSTDQSPNVSPTQTVTVASPSPVPTPSPIFRASPSNFTCDGREYCSQMSSREEAIFFIRNCPNTKMDGDNDGHPCENDSRF